MAHRLRVLAQDRDSADSGVPRGRQEIRRQRFSPGWARSVVPVASRGLAPASFLPCRARRDTLRLCITNILRHETEIRDHYLLSEDLQDSQVIDGVQVVDPFSRRPGELG